MGHVLDDRSVTFAKSTERESNDDRIQEKKDANKKNDAYKVGRQLAYLIGRSVTSACRQ